MKSVSGASLAAYLDREGWSRFSESLVMRLDLERAVLSEAIDQIPLKDIARFVTAALALAGADPGKRAGLSEAVGSIEAEAGLFVHETDGTPVATGAD